MEPCLSRLNSLNQNYLIDRPEPAVLDTGLALRALLRVDVRDLAFFPLDRARGTVLEAQTALFALAFIHHELDKRRADAGRRRA